MLLKGDELRDEQAKAASLPRIDITSRENGDLIMMGIGGFSPLDGFMGKADWKSVCTDMQTADGTFWPIPITLSVDGAQASAMSRKFYSVQFCSETTHV